MLECDVLIFDIFRIEAKYVEFAIKSLTYQDLKAQKTLVLISSVRAWAKTPPKIKRSEEDVQEGDIEEEGDDEAEEENEEDQEPEPEAEPQLDADGNEIEKPEILPFRERDYFLRRTYTKYNKIKSLETLCLSAGKSKPNLNTYVLCCGLPYGLGEEVLFPILKVISLYSASLAPRPSLHHILRQRKEQNSDSSLQGHRYAFEIRVVPTAIFLQGALRVYHRSHEEQISEEDDEVNLGRHRYQRCAN